MPPVDSIEFLASLAVALSASFHCLGMCGGFAVAASVSTTCRAPRGLRVVPERAAIARQLLYHGGKATSYVFLGTLAASMGAVVTRSGSTSTRLMVALAGLFLVAVGAGALGIPRRGQPTPLAPPIVRGAWSRWGRALVSLDSPARPLYLGMFSGLLPCPLVYAFLGRVAARATFIDAVATMAALALGTAPLLCATAFCGELLSPLARRRLRALSGMLMILLGVWTVYRGWSAPTCCVQ